MEKPWQHFNAQKCLAKRLTFNFNNSKLMKYQFSVANERFVTLGNLANGMYFLEIQYMEFSENQLPRKSLMYFQMLSMISMKFNLN